MVDLARSRTVYLTIAPNIDVFTSLICFCKRASNGLPQPKIRLRNFVRMRRKIGNILIRCAIMNLSWSKISKMRTIQWRSVACMIHCFIYRAKSTSFWRCSSICYLMTFRISHLCNQNRRYFWWKSSFSYLQILATYLSTSLRCLFISSSISFFVLKNPTFSAFSRFKFLVGFSFSRYLRKISEQPNQNSQSK